MINFNWNKEKNEKLITQRNLSFEEVIISIEQGHLLDIIENPNKDKYKGQKIFIVEMKNYAYIIPYLEDENEIFLKTIIPSRKMTKKYLRKD